LFLGYDSHRKGYLCLTEFGKFIVSCHVLFNEFIFSYSMPNNYFQLSDNIRVEPPTSPSLLTVVSLPPTTTPPDNPIESSPLLSTATSYLSTVTPSLSTATPSSSTTSTSSSPSSTPEVALDFNVHPMVTLVLKMVCINPKCFSLLFMRTLLNAPHTNTPCFTLTGSKR